MRLSYQTENIDEKVKGEIERKSFPQWKNFPFILSSRQCDEMEKAIKRRLMEGLDEN
jgi:hypothetical protein